MAVLVALALGVAGCGARQADQPPSAADTGAPEAPVEARASVDRAVATTGDILTFQVTVLYDSAYEVDVPEPGAAIQGFRIVDSTRIGPNESGGRLVRELIYRLRADLVGSYILPSVVVSYRPAGAPEEETLGAVETSEIFVEVESVLPADGSAEDIRGLKPLRPIDSERRWWIWAAVAAALLAALFIYFRRRGGRPAVVASPDPPHQIAFRALDALRATDFSDPVAVRRFYFRISEALRVYVEGRFGLNATDLTTEEILPALVGLPELAEGERGGLESFLVHTDRVKFAEHRPSEGEIQATYEGALGFVEATQPKAIEEEELAA